MAIDTAALGPRATGATVTGDGSLTVTPTLTGAAFLSPTGAGALTVTPTLTGAALPFTSLGSGTLTMTPTLTGDGVRLSGQVGSGSLTVTPTLTGAGVHTVVAAAAATVTPSLSGTCQVADATWYASAQLTVAPTLTGAAYVVGHGAAATLTVAPVLYAYARTTPHGGFIMAAAQLPDARAQWPDAVSIPDGVLTNLLESAWTACEAFLPTAVVSDPGYAPHDVPGYVQANVLHARDLFTAYRREGDVIGFDSYAVRVRPLSDTVRALLRPATGRALVG